MPFDAAAGPTLWASNQQGVPLAFTPVGEVAIKGQAIEVDDAVLRPGPHRPIVGMNLHIRGGHREVSFRRHSLPQFGGRDLDDFGGIDLHQR